MRRISFKTLAYRNIGFFNEEIVMKYYEELTEYEKQSIVIEITSYLYLKHWVKRNV